MRRSATGVFCVATQQIDLRLLGLRTPTALAVKKMAVSLKKQGQLTPVILCEDAPRPILVDGFKRLQAAQSLGLDTLQATCLSADPIQAKALMYLINRAGSFSMIQEAMLARELVDTDGLSQTQAARLLERHKSWVSRRLLMIRRLAPEILEDLKLQLLPPGCAAALARVAPCNQADFSAAIQAHRLSAKELRQLIALWCKAPDPGVKQFLLQAPREALQVIKEQQGGAQETLRGIFKLLASLQRQCPGRQHRESLQQIQSALITIEHTLSKESTNESFD
jgi:ParB-like chromosome segregation protein Spo0J